MSYLEFFLLSVATPVLYPVLATSFYMLGARDLITRPFWSRYPVVVDKFMTCPACSGTWYGAALALGGGYMGWPFFGLPGWSPVTIVVVALYTKILTPIIAAKHISTLLYAGDADGADAANTNDKAPSEGAANDN